MLRHHPHDAGDGLLEGLIPGMFPAERGEDPILHPGVIAPLHRLEQADLVGETGVDAAHRRAGTLHDLGDRHVVETALADEGFGGIEDALERLVTPPLHGRPEGQRRSPHSTLPLSHAVLERHFIKTRGVSPRKSSPK